VKKIFDTFWHRFASEDEQTMALRTLKLEADASRNEITRSYRELISQHHPDKGGDVDEFNDIKVAAAILEKKI
jgi:DnaJ-class molecular chaperone